jgi:hypothetical protein
MKKYVNFGSGIPVKLIAIAVILYLVKTIVDSLKGNDKDVAPPVNPLAVPKAFEKGGTIDEDTVVSIAAELLVHMKYAGTDVDGVNGIIMNYDGIDLKNIYNAFGNKLEGETWYNLITYIESEQEFGEMSQSLEKLKKLIY